MNAQKNTGIYECDVEDKQSLARFREKRDEWKRCLIDDQLSISHQISHLLWNDTVFRAFNEARRLSLANKKGDTGLNGPIINLIDEGFVVSQVMAIRRLSDQNYDSPRKKVISLLSIISDIEKNLGAVLAKHTA